MLSVSFGDDDDDNGGGGGGDDDDDEGGDTIGLLRFLTEHLLLCSMNGGTGGMVNSIAKQFWKRYSLCLKLQYCSALKYITNASICELKYTFPKAQIITVLGACK